MLDKIPLLYIISGVFISVHIITLDAKSRIIRHDYSFSVLNRSHFCKFRTLQMRIWCTHVIMNSFYDTGLHISILWSFLHRMGLKVQMFGRVLLFSVIAALFGLSALDVNRFISTWSDNLRRSRSVSISFRPLFACWFDVSSVKTYFTVLYDTLAISTSSSFSYLFEYPNAMTHFCQSVTCLFWSILQHTKAKISK